MHKASAEAAGIVQTNATHISKKKAPNSKEFPKESLLTLSGTLSSDNRTSRFMPLYSCDAIVTRTDPIDGSLRKLVSITLRSGILYRSHHPTLAGSPRERCIYKSRLQHFYWLHIAIDLYKPLCKCRACAQNGSQLMPKGKFWLFPDSKPLQLWPLICLDRY